MTTYKQSIKNPRELDRVLDEVRRAILGVAHSILIVNVDETTVQISIIGEGPSAATTDAEVRRAVFIQASADYACTFSGFVPSITVHADGTIVVVEQDNNGPEHLADPNVLPTRVHTIKGGK